MKRRRIIESEERQNSNPNERNIPHSTSSLDRRRVELCGENGHRSSWHGTSASSSIEQGTSQLPMATGVTVRSHSSGSLQAKSRSRIKLFHRRSYPVNPTPPPSPSKESNVSSLRTFFQNIKRGKLKAHKHASKSAKGKSSLEDKGACNVTDNTTDYCDKEADACDDVDGETVAKKRIRTSPDIESEESDASDEAIRGVKVQLVPQANELGAVGQDIASLSVIDSDSLRLQTVDAVGATNSEIPRPGPHPIHTFQRREFRTLAQNQSRVSIFRRSRSRKSVIQEVEENLTHPVIIVILSVINFVLWVFLVGVKVVRISSAVSLWVGLRFAYMFEFFVKLFYRIFNLDPEKANQLK